MFLERCLANEFWIFLREQAIPEPHEIGRPTRVHLDDFEREWRSGARMLANAEAQAKMPVYPDDNDETTPWVYATLQEALIGFLVMLAAEGREQIREDRESYEMWLRTVVLIITDAQHTPSWLEFRKPATSSNVDALEITNDWSCIGWSTYHLLVRRFIRRDDAWRSTKDQ